MSRILPIAAALFADRAWDAVLSPGDGDADGDGDGDGGGAAPVLTLEMDASRVRWTSHARAADRDRFFLFESVLHERVPAARRAAVAEYLDRVNRRLEIASCELDWDDGSVRIKTGIDFHGEPPTRPLIAGVVEANFEAATRYLPGVRAVVRGERTPIEALADASEG